MARSSPAPYRRLLCVLLAGVPLVAAGCDSPPRVYPVQGTVVIKGKGHVKDLAGYNVQFQSVGEPGERPGGTIEEDGTFTLFTRWGGKVVPGVKEGTYRACLLPPAPEGRPAPPLIIPARYTKFETSDLQYQISPGPNTITLEVQRDR